MSDLLNAYLEEQLDRQAFWIIRQIPELDHTDEANKGKEVVMEENRSEVCFKTGLTGFHMTMVFYELTKLFESRFDKKLGQFDAEVDKNFGCLPMEVENAFQEKLKQIKKVDNFKKYYTSIGIDCPDNDALTLRLRQAITNSKEKRYHGSSEHMNVLPTMAEQANTLLTSEPTAFANYDETTKQFTDASDPIWKKHCHARFPWVMRFDLHNHEPVTPEMIAFESDKRHISLFKDQDALRCMLNEEVHGKFDVAEIKNMTALNEYEKTNTWRHLFHKLCFEQMLEHFLHTLDFKLFYKFISDLGPEISVLRIPALDKTKLKSNHYWLMTLLGRMPNLISVKFHRNNENITPDFFKFMAKGMAYMQKEGRELKKIAFEDINGKMRSAEHFYSVLKHHPNLICLQVSRCAISPDEAKAIGKVLADFKFIKELDISQTQLDANTGKEIADGLMRAKQLEIFKCEGNPLLGKTLDTIIYNLAFSPKIKIIDLSSCGSVSKDTGEALYKLLKISGAIECLTMSKTNVSNYLTVDFMKALGENKTLVYLNLDENGPIGSGQLQIGKAIAMNAYKNGSLTGVSIRNWIASYTTAELFFLHMSISEQDHEHWYGDRKTADAMQKEQLDKKLTFGLKFLDMQGGNFGNFGINFRPKNIVKQTNPTWPNFLHWVTKTKIDLNLRDCKINSKDMELFAHAIGQNPVGDCQIRVLNLSKNLLDKEGCKLFNAAIAFNKSIVHLDLSKCKMGVSGIKNLCASLKTNSTLQSLNLYRNIIDVDGARSLGAALKENKSLEFLDIGHNRIRITGLKAIIDGVTSNAESKLVKLGIRANFINDEGFTELFERLVFSKGKHHLTHVFLE